MISTVPYTLGLKFSRTGDVRYVAPPMEIPPIPLKQFWHRRVKSKPAVSWLRNIIAGDYVNRDPYDFIG